MATFFYIAALWMATTAALPTSHQLSKSDEMEQINPLEYYYPHPEVNNFYQPQPANTPNAAPARLETLEPDSEVELIPGSQSPQQPPQQVPVSPNGPGLMPDQRVFFVHMPIPGLRPGPIGGYQGVYILRAGPQGNTAYPGNGYQNTLLLGPQVFNYPAAQANPNYVFGVPGSRPYVAYQDPSLYQQVQLGGGPSLRLAQLVSLQGTHPVIVGPSIDSVPASEPQRKNQDNIESKEIATENQNNKQQTKTTQSINKKQHVKLSH